MRFQQMKQDPNTIMRKKMYKKGKNWIVASTLALGASVAFGTTVVDAATTQGDSSETTDVSQNHKDDSKDKENGDFELPAGLGKGDIKAYGKNGTSNYFVSYEGTLYLTSGEISVKDTQEIGRKYGTIITKIDNYSGGTVSTPENSAGLFDNYFSNVKEIRDYFDATKTKDMSSMFSGMSSLTDFSVLSNVNKVTNMNSMFKNCKSLNRIILYFNNTSNVTDTSEMFSGVLSLRRLDLSFLDLSSVVKSKDMFLNTNLDIISLGKMNKFSKDTILPSKSSDTWISVGGGTSEKPNGVLEFSSKKAKDSISKYYDGSNNFGNHTFVPKKNSPVNPGTPTQPSNPQTPNKPIIPTTPTKPNNNSNNNETTVKPQVVNKISKITTFSDKGNVTIYHINGNKVTKANRMLAANTNWMSDQQLVIDGVTYLRVATNEWIKLSDGYNYEAVNKVVSTKWQARLVDAHGNKITNRALQVNSDWRTDMIVYIDNVQYYRVATNEFIAASDVR